jgi:transposase
MQAGTKEVTQLARELGVPRQYLHAWFRQAQKRQGQSSGDVFPGNGNLSSADAEFARLRKENAQLKEDNEILKKRRPSSPKIPAEISVYRCASLLVFHRCALP